jgi:hypothetical protein
MAFVRLYTLSLVALSTYYFSSSAGRFKKLVKDLPLIVRKEFPYIGFIEMKPPSLYNLCLVFIVEEYNRCELARFNEFLNQLPHTVGKDLVAFFRGWPYIV